MGMTSATPQEEWGKLTPAERAAWAGFLRVHADLIRALDTELQTAHELPMSSYDVLIQLAIAPGGRLQMFQLADAVHLSRSGLSRLVARLVDQGLVERCECPSDARGAFAVITDAGRERLAGARATHRAGVRARFLDRLDEEQQRRLAGVWATLAG